MNVNKTSPHFLRNRWNLHTGSMCVKPQEWTWDTKALRQQHHPLPQNGPDFLKEKTKLNWHVQLPFYSLLLFLAQCFLSLFRVNIYMETALLLKCLLYSLGCHWITKIALENRNDWQYTESRELALYMLHKYCIHISCLFGTIQIIKALI